MGSAVRPSRGRKPWCRGIVDVVSCSCVSRWDMRVCLGRLMDVPQGIGLSFLEDVDEIRRQVLR